MQLSKQNIYLVIFIWKQWDNWTFKIIWNDSIVIDFTDNWSNLICLYSDVQDSINLNYIDGQACNGPCTPYAEINILFFKPFPNLWILKSWSWKLYKDVVYKNGYIFKWHIYIKFIWEFWLSYLRIISTTCLEQISQCHGFRKYIAYTSWRHAY